jgi:hypothetical protein
MRYAETTDLNDFAPLTNPGQPFPKDSQHFGLMSDPEEKISWTFRSKFPAQIEKLGYRWIRTDARPFKLAWNWPDGGDFIQFEKAGISHFFWFPLSSLYGE